MIEMQQARRLRFTRSVSYLRAVLLSLVVALTFNGFSAATASHHHEFRSEVQLSLPSTDLPSSQAEDHCLSCHVGCGCHDALPAMFIAQLAMPCIGRLIFVTEDGLPPSACLERPAKPPRPRAG